MSQDSADLVSATVRRWQLTESLRQLRDERGWTIEQAATELRKGQGRWSRSKLQRLETREQGIKPRDLEQILDGYGVTDEETRTRLMDLATKVNERGYWLAIRKDLPDDFHSVLEVEGALIAQRQFENMVVPGLLQTADYARALMFGASPGLTREAVERRVLARMARQQVLTKAQPLNLHVIIDESILERPVGGPTVMRNQLRRLRDEAENEHINVQVLPKAVGASPAVDGSFLVLTLPEPIPDFGYVETAARAIYIEDRDAVRDLTLRFGILTERALSAAESVSLIDQAARGFG